MLKASCQPDNSLTTPAQLATSANGTMLEAVKAVRSALKSAADEPVEGPADKYPLRLRIGSLSKLGRNRWRPI